jgi:RNA polymerase sigma factor (sigma-70 family)
LIATVSGQAGFAVVTEGVMATAYSIDDPGAPAIIRTEHLHSLFRGATDVMSVDVPDHRAAVSLLTSAWSCDRLLQMMIILLRRDARDDVRAMAAEAADELFNHRHAERFAMNRLYSHPLTSDADLSRAIRIAQSARAETTTRRLQELERHQDSIARVSSAWKTVLNVTPERNRSRLRQALESNDVFRRLGRAVDPRQIDQFEQELLLQRLPMPLTAEVFRYLTNSQRRALKPPERQLAYADSKNPEEMLLQNLTMIERIIAFLGRRHGVEYEDLEDLAGSVKLALIENDYAVLRKFEHRSTLATYLHTVITRMVLRYARVRWQPSREARRMGDHAVRMERLLWRDGRSFREACEIVMATTESITAADLEVIYRRLPQRRPRLELVPLSFDVVDPKPLIVDEVIANEIATVLASSIEDLSADDRTLLQMRFWQERKISDIARVLHQSQKTIYKRIDGALRKIRQRMTQTGVNPHELNTFLIHSETEIALADPLRASGQTVSASRFMQSVSNRDIN